MAWTNPPKTWTTGELVDATDMNTHIRDQLIAIIPIGTLILRAAPHVLVETAVEGRWLQCNGVNVSRTTYSALFTYFNSLSPALPFGAGDGVTTFGIPDMRGRVPVAEGGHADTADMGFSDGLIGADRTPKHYHQTNYGSDSLGGSVPAVGAFDVSITRTYPTSAATPTAYGAQDTPSFLVVGSYFIKYL